MRPALTIVQENDRFKIFEDGEPLQLVQHCFCKSPVCS
jgi:hypothetical protein